MILAAAEGKRNAEIARELEVSVDTVRSWRMRWIGLQAVSLKELPVSERLSDIQRPGRPSDLLLSTSPLEPDDLHIAPGVSMSYPAACALPNASLVIPAGFTPLASLTQRVDCSSCVKTWVVTTPSIKSLVTVCALVTFPTAGIS